MTAECTELKRWPRLLPFRQPTLPGRLVVAAFVSMAIHAVLLFLLSGVVVDRTAFKPVIPSDETSLVVSLSTFTPASIDEMERESVSKIPHTDPPAQAPSERSPATGHQTDVETVVTSKAPEVPDSGAETVATSNDQGGPVSETPGDESIATDEIPSFDLEASYHMAREVGRMSMSEIDVQSPGFESRKLYLKNRLGIVRPPPGPDCGTAYAGMGYVGIPFLLLDTFMDGGCEWKNQVERERLAREREKASERQKEQERLDSFKGDIDRLIFGWD